MHVIINKLHEVYHAWQVGIGCLKNEKSVNRTIITNKKLNNG